MGFCNQVPREPVVYDFPIVKHFSRFYFFSIAKRTLAQPKVGFLISPVPLLRFLGPHKLKKSKIIKTTTKQAKIPTTLAKKAIASCFRFSINSCNGSDKNKNPITAADNTNNPSITIGIIMVSFCKIEVTVSMERTTITI